MIKTIIMLLVMTMLIGCADIVPEPTSRVMDVTAENWNEVLEVDLAIVDFYADWCPPCKELAPILEEIAKANPDIAFFRLDINKDKELWLEYKWNGIPMLVFFVMGQLEYKVLGLKTFDELQNIIEDTF